MQILTFFVREVADHCHVEGTSATVNLVSKRTPREKTPETMDLFEKSTKHKDWDG